MLQPSEPGLALLAEQCIMAKPCPICASMLQGRHWLHVHLYDFAHSMHFMALILKLKRTKLLGSWISTIT
jgi:hypothetical protein